MQLECDPSSLACKTPEMFRIGPQSLTEQRGNIKLEPQCVFPVGTICALSKFSHFLHLLW